eukprot:sb/3463773/
MYLTLFSFRVAKQSRQNVMQSGNRHMRDQRDSDLVRSLKSPMVFSTQMGSQRGAPNPKLMTITHQGKQQSAIYNSRFPNPSIFTAKSSPPTHEGASAFSVPRSSAFNRVAALQTQAGRRKEEMVEPKSRGGQVVWQQASSNEQVYRMAHIQQQPGSNGSSIIQIPQNLPAHHPSFYMDPPNVSTPFFNFNSQNVPLVINSNINGYLSSRPSILRKVAKPPPPTAAAPHHPPHHHDHNGSYGEVFKGLKHGRSSMHGGVSTSVSSGAATAPPVSNDPYVFCDSPRKKPRKQVVIAHEDSYASNVPEVIVPVGGIKQQQHPVVQQEDTISFYTPCRRMSLLPASAKIPRGDINHFERYRDVKVRKKRKFNEPVPEASYIASQGWRLIHLKSQLEELTGTQRENKAKICEFRDYFCSLEIEEKKIGGGGGSSSDSIGELVTKITHCCHNNGSQMKQVMGALDKLVNSHKPRVLELVRELKDRNTSSVVVSAATTAAANTSISTPVVSGVTRRKRTPPPKKEVSSKKKSRKRKT